MFLCKAEEYYRGQGGTEYWSRNLARLTSEYYTRPHAIRSLLGKKYVNRRWLELGCGMGTNMRMGDVGIDIDPRVLVRLRSDNKIGLIGNARFIPFIPGNSFPVVFCVGLLMHLPDEYWQQAFREMVRTSIDYVICGEYDASEERVRVWEGEEGLLWERPYGRLWCEGLLADMAENLKLVEVVSGVPPFDDDVTFFIWRKLA